MTFTESEKKIGIKIADFSKTGDFGFFVEFFDENGNLGESNVFHYSVVGSESSGQPSIQKITDHVFSTDELPYSLIAICEQKLYFPLEKICWFRKPNSPALPEPITECLEHQKLPLYLNYSEMVELEDFSIGCAATNALGTIISPLVAISAAQVNAFEPPKQVEMITGRVFDQKNCKIINFLSEEF